MAKRKSKYSIQWEKYVTYILIDNIQDILLQTYLHTSALTKTYNTKQTNNKNKQKYTPFTNMQRNCLDISLKTNEKVTKQYQGIKYPSH